MEQRDEVIKRIRSICISTKEKMTVRQLNNDYRSFMGEPIPYQKLGFRTLEDLIQSSSDLYLTRSGSDFCVTAQQSEKSAHMADLIAKQKSGKRKPFRVRFSRGPLPPRMQQTSRWRPKTNFQTRYQGSSRPQAVSHSQFVNKSPASKPSAPSVSSKVVIPEHSTYNTKQAQPQIQPAAPVKRSVMHQRLTSSRIQENMKALANSNIQNGHGYTVSHIGTSLQSNNIAQNQLRSIQIDISENSTDPLVSTKKRLSKKMSQLSLERDSGNSSPTNDILPPSPSKTPDFIKAPDFFKAPNFPTVPDFTRTNDPLTDLKRFAQIHKLGEVTVDIAQLNKKKKLFSCKIKIGQKHTYTSYPEDFTNPLEAQTYCCEQALKDLIPKCKRKSMMISSEQDILTRIPPMLEKHNHGIWAWQLKLDYADKFNEVLSDDWLQIIDSSPRVQIEKMSGDYILYHCQPGDVLQRGQQRGAGSIVPLSNVSIPANTVQFGEDGKLLSQVTCVVSANEIWCEQIGTEESVAFAEMFSRMQIYYQEHLGQLVPDTILPAGYYIAKHEQLYYRVRVLKVNEEDVNCFFIDYGDEMAVPKTDIFVLKREYATSQAQAFVCRLYGLEDLYSVSVNSQALASLYDKPIELELAVDVTSNENINDVLPVLMYEVDTGESINEELIPKLTMELATPCLQPDGITEVYISNIESNGDIYVQVRTQGYETLRELRTQIEEQVTAKPPNEILYKITKSNSEGKLYFMKHNATGSWYRAKLIDWSPDGEYAQIYFVDEGHTDVIKVAEETLYPLDALNDVFNNYPHQAVRVRMALDIIPTNFVELAGQAMPKDLPVLLKTLRLTDDDITLVKLFRRNTDGGLFCINESVALQSELNKKEDNLKNKFKLPQLSGSLDHVPSTGSLKCPPLPKLEDDDYLKVYVSVAVNPYNFFVQPYDSKFELDLMMERLQERYMNVQYGNLKINDIMPGSIYASKHEDGFWYRTSVIKVINSGASVSVFYCDFGYYQTLSLKQLFPLDDEFMKLPYQALKAKLAGIKPKNSKWTMEDCEKFKELIEKKLLFARLTDIEKDILYESDLVLKLFLVDTSSSDDIIIGQELVKSGIAVDEE